MAVSRLDRMITRLFAVLPKLKDQMRKGHPDGFSFPQMATLRCVHELGTPTMKEIAERLLVRPPTATAMIAGLVDAGLLGRSVDKKDRRTVRLRLTRKGAHALVEGKEALVARLRDIFARLDGPEQESLIAILEKLAGAQ